VSDFLTRLIARSSGERPLVRPRIAPAFSQVAESGQRSPAGEVLRNSHDRLPAVAPFPFDPVQRKESYRRPEETEKTRSSDAGKEVSPNAPSLQDFPAGKERALEGSEEKRDNGSRAPKQTIVVASTPMPTREREIHQQQQAEAPKIFPFQMRDAPVNPLPDIRPSQEQPQGEPSVPAAPLQPSILQVPRPSRKNPELRTEPARKPAANEQTIQVTIGRIEVRASIVAPKSANKKQPASAMSLEEYQRLRNRRSAG